MSEAAKHTPTPWAIKQAHAPSDGEYDFAIVDQDNKVIAETFGCVAHGIAGVRPAEANAALIVKAVNSHAALVAALTKFASHYPTGINPWLDEAYVEARVALKSAA